MSRLIHVIVAAVVAAPLVAAPLVAMAQGERPSAALPEPGPDQGCGYYAVVGAARSRETAVELQARLGAPGSGILDHDAVTEFRDGFFSIVFGPFAAEAQARDRVGAWRREVPDAYVKFGCVEGSAPVAVAAPEPPATLPLPEGVYVLQGVNCARPPETAFRVFDGTGFSGPTTRACRFTIEEAEGEVYRGPNSCENVLYGLRTETALEVRLLGPDAFRLVEFGAVEGDFRLCPDLDPEDYAAG